MSEDVQSVRSFIAERTANPEHRQDVLDGDYDGTEWFAHVRAALAAAPAQAVELTRFRKLASWVANCAGHGINDSQRRMGEELLAMIDSHKRQT